MLETAFGNEDPTNQPVLLQAFLLRGVWNLLRINPDNLVRFLMEKDLLIPLIHYLKNCVEMRS